MTTQIHGRRITLDGRRSVFLGHKEGSDGNYIEFVSAVGALTRVILSPEALDALHQLRQPLPDRPTTAESYDLRTRAPRYWQQVSDTDG